MRVNIAESIREVLCDRQAVSIYGLGTLCLKQIPAKYGEKRLSLVPPTMILEFTEKSSTNEYLNKWLEDKYDLTATQAADSMKLFSENVLNMLLNYGNAAIKGVAKFHRDQDNEITIEASESLLSQFFGSYPEVFLNDTTASNQETTPIGEQIEESENQTNKSVPVISYSDNIEEPEAINEELNIDIPSSQLGESEVEEYSSGNAKTIEDVAPEELVTFDLESEKELPQTANDTESIKFEPHYAVPEPRQSSRRNIGYFLLIASAIALICLGVDACRKKTKLNQLKSEMEYPTAKNVFEGTTGSDSLSNAMLQGSEMVNSHNPEICVIVTGVFKSVANVSKMTKMIADKGYSIYTEERGQSTRVGLQFDCDNVDLEAFIRQVRKEISPKAWYLNPELYVAYQ